MATNDYSNDGTLKILYMIPSITIYPPDQIYIYVESEREYDLLAIARLGDSIIPIIFELASGKFEEADKLVREARLWPYPLIWVIPREDRRDRSERGIGVFTTLSPRVINEDDLLMLIDQDFMKYTKKIWNYLLHILECSERQYDTGDLKVSIKEIAKSLFTFRWILYSIGAEIPIYIYFSYLYLSKADLDSGTHSNRSNDTSIEIDKSTNSGIENDNNVYDGSSPWDWVYKSLMNTFSLIVDGSRSEGGDNCLNLILEKYANILEAELRLLETTINCRTRTQSNNHKSIILEIMKNQVLLLNILRYELKSHTHPPDRGQQKVCPSLHEEVASGSNAYIPRLYPRKLIEMSKEENLHLLLLPQEPKRRRIIEDIMGRSLEDIDACGEQRRAKHSCTLKYIIGGRLCEFLNLIRNLRQTHDPSNFIRDIRIAAINWDGEQECEEAEEDFKSLISRDICDVKVECEIDIKKFLEKFDSILKSLEPDHSLVIHIISDYGKNVIRGILSKIDDKKGSLKAKIWIAISPAAIYVRNTRLAKICSTRSGSLEKILDVCFLEANKMGCLQVEPLRIYIDELYSLG